PTAWNAALSNCGDRTTGTGNMLLVNGSPTPNVVVWQQSVVVQPNTNYEFSTWLQALWPPNPAQLQFAINGVQIGNVFSAQLPTCTWRRFNTLWNSGNNTTAVISVENKNTAIQGNDFALDDMSFAPVTYKTDSVFIRLSSATITASADTVVCSGTPVRLGASGGSTYQWQPAAGLSDASSSNPLATIVAGTRFVVTGTDANGCTGTDTVNVGVLPTPLLRLLPTDTTICPGASVVLRASGASQYRWSPATNLSDTLLSNPVATPTGTIRYTVRTTGANGCAAADSVLIAVRPKPQFALLPDSSSFCAGASVTLAASGGDAYLWQPALGLSGVTTPQVVASPTQSATYKVRIVSAACNDTATLVSRVVVNANPELVLSKSNELSCSQPTTQLTASGALFYAWRSTPGLSNYAMANPMASPTSTTTYAVVARDANGCSDTDSITVVFGLNADFRLFQLPNAFTPNGDGNNDCFGIRKWGNVAVKYFEVFNRWGQLIFTSKNASNCWNGNFKGNPQPSGNYIYRLWVDTPCGPIKREGNVVLIR
ncbi:MAG: gliding motility-associated C-terminal domain-containing protein, partial [Bacteroidetes bacterium]